MKSIRMRSHLEELEQRLARGDDVLGELLALERELEPDPDAGHASAANGAGAGLARRAAAVLRHIAAGPVRLPEGAPPALQDALAELDALSVGQSAAGALERVLEHLRARGESGAQAQAELRSVRYAAVLRELVSLLEALDSGGAR